MKLAAYLLYGSYTILWSQFHLANALVGESVRAANENEYAGVVSIQLNSGRNEPVEDHICTGVLVTNQDVVTADYCLGFSYESNGYRISAGTTDLLTNSYYYPAWWLTYLQSLRIGYIRRRARYQDNDIAIIRLATVVVPEINIPTFAYVNAALLYGTKAMTTGWGKFPNGTTNHILQTVEVTFLHKTECDEKLSRARGQATNPLFWSIIEPILQCSISEPHALLTEGDFGGPVFLDHEVIALNKKPLAPEENIADADRVNIHLNIEYYRAYIQQILEM